MNYYQLEIYERYRDLINSGKKAENLNNNDLWKIFEYFVCLRLTKEKKKIFYEYDDISPEFKEENKMSRSDTGIDCCDLDSTIVQCKLRNKSLTWEECATFFGSQTMFCSKEKKPIIRWNNLIIARNKECSLSKNILCRSELFVDQKYKRQELIDFCENLIKHPPTYPKPTNTNFKLRDYQNECIDLIQKSNKNVTISLPTGTGKNIVIIHSIKNNCKYLILVPRIILMDQLKKEIIIHRPELKNKIQTIGDGNNKFSEKKDITICVFNSISLVTNVDFFNFDKIFIDEAHHIRKPEIYEIENDSDSDSGSDSGSDSDSDSDSDDNTNSNYLHQIQKLSQYSNNVYLSATIDKIDNFEYYNKDIRNMINQKYLSDYTIHIPIFTKEAQDKTVCEHLIKNYKNVIIYCSCQKEGKEINKLMNDVLKGCSKYIDCETSKKERDLILESYKKGTVSFLVNVKVLVEGFDAPITKGVCFMHLPNSNNTIIQIIGRALRLHPQKTTANIILPFLSENDEKSINKFLRIIARNDYRIKKSYENKKLYGYILIDKHENEEDKVEKAKNVDDEEEDDVIDFRYNLIYDSMGTLQNGVEIWLDKLERVKEYIEENGKRPSKHDKNKEISIIGNWLIIQNSNHKNKKENMKNTEIYDRWTKFTEQYREYFKNNDQKWYDILEKVKKYINENKKRPSAMSKDKNIKFLGYWISTQNKNYETKEQIMKNKDIQENWKNFLNQYKEYLKSNEEIWFDNLEKVKKYIDQYNKRPSKHDKNKEIKYLGVWIGSQLEKYTQEEALMKQVKIYNEWTNFITKYNKYFESLDSKWKNMLEKVKKFVEKNQKLPSIKNKSSETKSLGIWIATQRINHRNKNDIMKKEQIYNEWTEFITINKQYFMNDEEIWQNMLNKVKKYIDENKKKPSRTSSDKLIQQLKRWMEKQEKLHEKNLMKENFKQKWQNFTNQYKDYL
jgi:Type III restriction enzyme, res subunit/Helicase conserved C-terminal domain/Helicase associated domain